MPMEMMTGKDMSPEMMDEMKAYKEEQRNREVMNDALYALSNIQKLAVMDSDRISGNPKMVDLLTQVRDGIDKLIGTGATPPPEMGVEAEPLPSEEAEMDTDEDELSSAGPLDEGKARKAISSMGFGKGRSMGRMMTGRY